MNSLSNRFGNSYILNSLSVFNQLGIVCITGIQLGLETEFFNPELKDDAIFCSDLVKNLIGNHQSTKCPLYDNHIVEISQAIFLLSMFEETDFIENWILEMLQNISFAFTKMGRFFPISSDSFDDLVSLNVAEQSDKESLVTMSTLLPILAHWCAVLNLSTPYNSIREIVDSTFQNTTLQMWYPDIETDSHLYSCNAAHHSGAVDAPIILPETIDELKEMIRKVQKNTIQIKELSAFNKGLVILPMIASRHFRTPFLPQYMHAVVLSK